MVRTNTSLGIVDTANHSIMSVKKHETVDKLLETPCSVELNAE